MTWNYRIFRRPLPLMEEFSVREAYYDDDGKVISFTDAPSAPYGDTLEELLADVAAFGEAINKPVIEITADGQDLADAVDPL